eukprot:TRINITY_DN1903_c0_g1_i3.p1 TRINITY_DN1903_c0_g1~~TRINITY_DN1903_c0_g1_i3.p1  ORF type:complete len:668 (+),score=135.04 TRINITY_DN1903_c0_g1_i3:36-2006(+)
MAEFGDSSHGGRKPFRHITRDRLLHDMLRTAKLSKSGSEWKVLVMDEVTVKVMSYSCKMADITDEGISLVEDINKRRQPLPGLEAVYFITPHRDSIKKFMADMSGKSPLYKKAHVFFSSPIARELLQHIKSDASVISRLAALREMNLEYLTVDTQGFVTDNDKALEQLFGEHSDGTRDFEVALELIAGRLATVFASLQEFPLVRYRLPPASSSSLPQTGRELVPTKLAASLWERLMKYKSSLANFPQSETCELVIVDRSLDPVAPVIHEWTYDAMCHDLLDLDGNKYSYEITTSSGKKEQKEVLLEEHDPVWVELRDLHIAEANLKLNEKMQLFGSKNKAAQIRLGGKDGSELSTKDMQKMVQALPQYRDQLDKLSLHIHIATVLNDQVKAIGLSEIGNLEQDFVFGDASSKELINLLNTKQDLPADIRLRLMMIYAATHPEKLDATKRMQWMKLARLSGDDMNALNNLEYIGVSVSKKSSSGFSLRFGGRKAKRPLREDKKSVEQAWQLSKFYPVLEDVLEQLAKGELPREEYPYVREPGPGTAGLISADSTSKAPSKPAQSMRTTGRGATWATQKARPADDGFSSDSLVNDVKLNGKRMFVFVVGGMTRSELRVCHKLTPQLRREVVIGSTSVLDPKQFLLKLKCLSTLDDIDL